MGTGLCAKLERAVFHRWKGISAAWAPCREWSRAGYQGSGAGRSSIEPGATARGTPPPSESARTAISRPRAADSPALGVARRVGSRSPGDSLVSVGGERLPSRPPPPHAAPQRSPSGQDPFPNEKGGGRAGSERDLAPMSFGHLDPPFRRLCRRRN